MILLEKTEVMGFEQAIRGMRNPINSWDRSDSGICKGGDDGIGCANCAYAYISNGCLYGYDHSFQIGKNDYELMMKLVRGGPVHAKFRRMITVYVDITAPLYWWKEFDTYKVGTVANSCSTMHKIHEKEFTLDDFSHEHLINEVEPIGEDSLVLENCCDHAKDVLKVVVKALNYYRKKFLETNDKSFWWQMIQLLPSSYNQKRTIMLNYEVLAGIYPMRKNHKLDEWITFCQWIEELSYSEVIIGEKEQCKTFNEIRAEHGLPPITNGVPEIFKPQYLAKPYSNWISVSKKLPEEDQEVLVTIEMDDSYGQGTKIVYEVDIAEFHKNSGYIESACGKGFFDTTNDWVEGQPTKVIAWMPKPSAYSESKRS